MEKVEQLDDIIKYLDKTEPEKLRADMLDRAKYIYNYVDAYLWSNASNVQELSDEQSDSLNKRIAELAIDNGITDPEELDKLSVKYKINTIKKYGRQLAEIGYILLSDKYKDKVEGMLELIDENYTKEDVDSFYRGLDKFLARWEIGENKTVRGDTHSLSDFKYKYFAGMILLYTGINKFNTLLKADARATKRHNDKYNEGTKLGCPFEIA